MNLHLLELFRSEAARFVDDVIGHGQLADVVQQSRGAQCVHFLLAQSKLLGDLHRVGAHTVQMLVRGVVLGVDGQGQTLNGAQVKRAHLFHMVLLGLHVALFDLDRAFLSSRRPR